MAPDRKETGPSSGGLRSPRAPTPLIIATILRKQGCTGVHTHVRQLSQYLRGHGTTPTLITPSSAEPLLSAAVFAVRLSVERVSGSLSVLWYRHWHEVFLRRALQRHLSSLGEAVVYAQGPLEARAALLARTGPHQRVVMAVHFHKSQAEEWVGKNYIARGGRRYRLIQEVERRTIPRVDALVYVSKAARDALVDWLPAAEDVPSAVIPNFVDAPDLLAPEHRLGDLVTLGGLEIAKNHQFLIQVLSEAKRLGRTLTLDIYGDGPCRKALVKKAAKLGLEGQVRIRGFDPDVRARLPAYRAYVHASLKETGPLAVIEAMAAGLPIVAGRVGGIPELYRPGVEGRFWPLDDPAEAAAVLLGLLESEEACREAGVAARARYASAYEANLLVPRLWSFVMGEPPLAPPDRRPPSRSSELVPPGPS